LTHVPVGEQRFAVANRIHPRVKPEGRLRRDMP
jgi:hypothetical protein